MGSVQFRTNAGNLAVNKRALANFAEEKFRHLARNQAERMKSVAVQLSSGTLSTATLRALGHPYARRFPANAAPFPDYIINIQGGDFINGWRTQVRRNGNDWTLTLYNVSPHAQFMLGTARMRNRPILDEVIRRSYPALPIGASLVVRKTLSQMDGRGGMPSSIAAMTYAVAVGVISSADAVVSAL